MLDYAYYLPDDEIRRFLRGSPKHLVRLLDCCHGRAVFGLREADGMKEVPDALNKIVDIVLAYRPKPKTKAARKRNRIKSKKMKSDTKAEKQS